MLTSCFRAYFPLAVTRGTQSAWINIARAETLEALWLFIHNYFNWKMPFPQYSCISQVDDQEKEAAAFFVACKHSQTHAHLTQWISNPCSTPFTLSPASVNHMARLTGPPINYCPECRYGMTPVPPTTHQHSLDNGIGHGPNKGHSRRTLTLCHGR